MEQRCPLKPNPSESYRYQQELYRPKYKQAATGLFFVGPGFVKNRADHRHVRDHCKSRPELLPIQLPRQRRCARHVHYPWHAPENISKNFVILSESDCFGFGKQNIPVDIPVWSTTRRPFFSVNRVSAISRMEKGREPNIVKSDLAPENRVHDLQTDEVTMGNPKDIHDSQTTDAQSIPADESQNAAFSARAQSAAMHSDQAQTNSFKNVIQRIIKRFEDFVNGLMEKFVNKAPSGLTQFIARLLFYPTLYWNRMVKAESSTRRWYDRITDRIILGALPEKKYIPILAEQEHVDVLLNLVREWKGLTKEYSKHNMTQVWVPMTDFVPPSYDDIKLCVQHLEDLVLTQNKTVYVHCKAGRGRSATVVMAFLMKHHNMTPLEAQRFLESKRPHVLHLLYERQVIKDFYKEFCEARSQGSSDREAVAPAPNHD